MRLSTKSRYGARAMAEIARQYNKPVKRKTIIMNQNLTDSYLENILIALKASGLIDTKRGSEGGYFLTRHPSEITMLQVIRALETRVSPVECLENPTYCRKADHCPTRKVWKKLEMAQVEVLNSITIQELLDDDTVIQ